MCGVDTDGEAARTCGDIVASEGALAALVEAAIGVKCERMSRDDGAIREDLTNFRVEGRHKFLKADSSLSPPQRAKTWLAGDPGSLGMTTNL